MAIDTVDEPDVELGDLTRLAAVFKSLGDLTGSSSSSTCSVVNTASLIWSLI
ncbi:regulatory protein [Cutibacterium acnes JCM 18918]|nr:regulatory protein [Cutibacterium acnes JCM 18918]